MFWDNKKSEGLLPWDKNHKPQSILSNPRKQEKDYEGRYEGDAKDWWSDNVGDVSDEMDRNW